MKDTDLANEIINRLNTIIKSHPDIKKDISVLIDHRVTCSKATADHPTIQVSQIEKSNGFELGLIGILNGIVGAIPEGKYKGFGYIGAYFDDNNVFQHFQRTDDKYKKEEDYLLADSFISNSEFEELGDIAEVSTLAEKSYEEIKRLRKIISSAPKCKSETYVGTDYLGQDRRVCQLPVGHSGFCISSDGEQWDSTLAEEARCPVEATTYIVRFTDASARDSFLAALRRDRRFARIRVELGEFLPDAILHSVEESELPRLRELAASSTRFIPDFTHDLIGGEEA